jgi:nickel-type superoxide dismutase maturation protease
VSVPGPPADTTPVASRRNPSRPLVPLGLVDVAGPSMSPTLRHGDVVLVRWGAPVRGGDVVVVRRPGPGALVLVKRVVRRVHGGWWVEGDSPAASTDSRHFGPVPDEGVLARVLVRLAPVRGPLRAFLRQPAARRRAR